MHKILNFTAILSMIACSSVEKDRPEKISKLRSIGTSIDPTIATFDPENPGNQRTSTYQFFVLQPKDNPLPAVEIINLDIKDSGLGQIPLVLAGDPLIEELGPLRLISQKAIASFTLPKDEFGIFSVSSFLTMNYGLAFVQGEDTERIVGKNVIFNSKLTPLVRSWQSPVLEFVEPVNALTVSGNAIVLKATLDSKADEEHKISWFCSAGSIVNRRALQTIWKDAPTGVQSLVVTARGRKTGIFVYKAITVTVI